MRNDSTSHPLRRLLRHARAHRADVVWASTCSITNKILDLAPPVLIGAAIDVVVEKKGSLVAQLGVDSVMAQLTVLAAATVLIWGLESLFEYLYAVRWRSLAQTLQHELRLDAYAHVQSLELAYFEDRSTGGLMAILNDDVNQLERFLDGGANALLQVLTTVVAVGALFFGIAPGVAVLSFLPVPFVLWGSFVFQKRIAPRYREVREHVAALNHKLSNNLSGIATIKSFTTEQFETTRIAAESEAYQASNQRAIRLSSAFSPLIRMVIVCGFVATLLYGGWLTEQGELAVGAYGVLVFLTQRLLWPLTRLGQTFDLYQRAMASTERLLDLIDTRATISTPKNPQRLGQIRGDLVLENVDFAYHCAAPVLRDFSLHIKAGETTAIVGPTGSGKTTITKLLLRFYDPTAGRVLFDGVELRTLSLADLRASIGLVSQDVFLFHGSIRENISYGSPGASLEKIIAASQAAEAHDFITQLPNGYDTVVGERGQKLSGGQRQRVSIARAVLKNPPVLIFDEATSSVDNETEAAIQRSLSRIALGRTTIIIAHRLSTVRNAHRIVCLENGKTVEQGTHKALLNREGLYKALWDVQTGAAIPTPARAS